ncbi:hypothetical protein CW700_04735 [Candidatus Bathyarchaeota archaeon]|nr:MAG: hypothetical protein CW700_04735 [Candidatus Bathyarchaeota archaeon]
MKFIVLDAEFLSYNLFIRSEVKEPPLAFSFHFLNIVKPIPGTSASFLFARNLFIILVENVG